MSTIFGSQWLWYTVYPTFDKLLKWPNHAFSLFYIDSTYGYFVRKCSRIRYNIFTLKYFTIMKIFKNDLLTILLQGAYISNLRETGMISWYYLTSWELNSIIVRLEMFFNLNNFFKFFIRRISDFFNISKVLFIG